MESNEQSGSDAKAPPGEPAVPEAEPTERERVDDRQGDELDEPERLTTAEKRLLGGLAAAALVVLAVVLAFNFFSGDDSDGTGGSGDDTAASDTTAVENPAVVPTVKALDTTTKPIVDAFDRSSLAGGKLGWTTLGEGDWTVSDGLLVSGNEPQGVSPLAVTEVPDGYGDNWAFSITVGEAGQATGLVWGVEDDQNYWEMRVNTEYAVVAFNHVQDGQPEPIKILGPAGLSPGERYTVQHVGDTVTLAANGAPFLTLTDESLATPRKVGVIASTDAPASFKLAEVASIDTDG